MKPALKQHRLTVALAFTFTVRAADPVPLWNDGPARQSITAFVEKVAKEGSADFVPVAGRIAAFDNDGTREPFDGAKNYQVNMPANFPAKDFWSVVV